jgi:hypothetical protein
MSQCILSMTIKKKKEENVLGGGVVSLNQGPV